MSKKTNTLIPVTRFPEFENEGEWEEKSLNKLGNLINGLTYSPNDIREKGLLVLRSSNVQNGQIVLNDCVYVKPEIKGANLTQPDDILVCIRNGSKALIGKNAIIPKSIPLATHGAFMTVFRAEYPKFVFQLFQTDAYNNQVNADLGATINSINGGNFLKYKFIVPKPNEQQKIASCLSSLDEVIAVHSQKLDAIKKHKKGLMQNLFPQEGETVPKYRFPEFVNDVDWVEKIVSQISEYENGKAHEQDIVEKGKYVVVNSKFISTDGEVRKFSNTVNCIAKKNDILMVLSDVPNGRAIAKCFYVDKDDFYTVNQRICKITPANADGKFLLYVLNRNQFFLAFDDGVKQTNLRNEDVLNCPIILPKSLKEQQKIASCLTTIDNLINAQAEKIEQLKLHKKGLMQGLFPKVIG